VGGGDGDLPSLADTIAAVGREVGSAQVAGLGQPVKFRTGPVELDLEVAVTRTGAGPGGVQVGVLTLGGKGGLAVTATQRVRVTLQPLGPEPGHVTQISSLRQEPGADAPQDPDGGVPPEPPVRAEDPDRSVLPEHPVLAEDPDPSVLPEHPVRAEGLEVHEVDDGLLVYQAQPECVHHLNNTAAIVFQLCDGGNTVPEIGEQLARAFGLAEVPDLAAEECLADLWSKGVIV
jgi:hypothetical protein